MLMRGYAVVGPAIEHRRSVDPSAGAAVKRCFPPTKFKSVILLLPTNSIPIVVDALAITANSQGHDGITTHMFGGPSIDFGRAASPIVAP